MTGPAPYPGMASFDAEQARWFRGRETLVADLLVRLGEQVLGGPPLVVVGVSGAGKSSLLRAGVLPAVGLGALGEGSGGWPWLVMTPGATPLADSSTGRPSWPAPTRPRRSPACAPSRERSATWPHGPAGTGAW